MSDKASLAEAFLFNEGGAIRKSKLSQYLSVDLKELELILDELQSRLQGGITLVRSETETALVIAREQSEILKNAHRKELGEEIGDAGLEVLAIVLYRGASTRAQIDYIRGVNTASTVRNLLTRGLLERTGNPLDGREYLYKPTTELLAYLGVTNSKDLPEYATIANELAKFASQNDPFLQHANTSDTVHDEKPR